MPELPEVETVKETLKTKLIGKKIEQVFVYHNNTIEYPNVEEFINCLSNQTIHNMERRGKWLLFELDEYYLLSHLRMEGKYFFREKNEPKLPHELVKFNFTDQESLRYHDTRKFGKMHLINKEKVWTSKPLNELGLEPWDPNLTTTYLKNKYKNKTIPIKTTLLDQKIITGIGNIYADEILYLSHINPLKKACDLTKKELENVILYTRNVLSHAIELGGTTIRSFSSSEGVHGLFQNELYIHGKTECQTCHTQVIKTKVGGRGTYYCPKCQKRK